MQKKYLNLAGLSNFFDKLLEKFSTKAEIANKFELFANEIDSVFESVDADIQAKADISSLTSHTSNTSNPHGVTKSQVGLGNVDNTSDANKPVSTAQANAIADAKKAGTDAQSNLTTHNTSLTAHNDIRELITGLTNRLNALADSDDTTLDQMSEIVAYIKNNKSLIDGVTTSKVNVSDIIDNLTTNVSNKPLSAARGVVINGLIDTLQTAVNGKVDSSTLTSHTSNTSNPHGVTLSQLGVTATTTELNYVSGVTSDIQTQLDGKANSDHTHSTYASLASPEFIGVPTAPTAAVGTNTTQIATTEFVQMAINNAFANIARAEEVSF